MNFQLIAGEMGIPVSRVINTWNLLQEGATVAFISRYRKEVTGNLDEQQVQTLKDTAEKYEELEKRKAYILKSIGEQDLLTPELEEKIRNTFDPKVLEDIYLPYKPKRKTRATTAKELGLEPLAAIVMKQHERDPSSRAASFATKAGITVEEALAGARDIIAEWISENARARNIIRNYFQKTAVLASKSIKTKEKEGEKYTDYFDFEQHWKKVPSHRALAIFRGENEKFLRVHLLPEEEEGVEKLERIFIHSDNASSGEVKIALKDSYKRLIAPSLENELRQELKEKADHTAIGIFGNNLSQLLLSPPLGEKAVLALDPGFRTGCKVAILDGQGKFLEKGTIFPHPPHNKVQEAARMVKSWITTFKISHIAVGNGTAGRETELFIRGLNLENITVHLVNESGASIYSASEVAREEFPDLDLTVRGAISIGRRLQDPLAELVKIDPKSIGVGQYQHDVNQAELKKQLDRVVESAVNSVGVNLNTASKHLLKYVSGLGPSLAANIVAYRDDHGAFPSRRKLLQVPRLGDKAFEQAAGFLRIPDSANPLDNSAVHPESYSIVNKMAGSIGVKTEDLLSDPALLKKLDPKNFISGNIGLPTIKDILSELEKPGRDPRGPLEENAFSEKIRSLEDLQEGMEITGKVNNITKFGAFIDLGIKENGLLHISEISDTFVSDPSEILNLGEWIQVKVLVIDRERKRISLRLVR